MKSGVEVKPVYVWDFDRYDERKYHFRINVWGWPGKVLYFFLKRKWKNDKDLKVQWERFSG